MDERTMSLLKLELFCADMWAQLWRPKRTWQPDAGFRVSLLACGAPSCVAGTGVGLGRTVVLHTSKWVGVIEDQHTFFSLLMY